MHERRARERAKPRDLVSRVRLTINLKFLVVLAAVLQPLVVGNTGC